MGQVLITGFAGGSGVDSSDCTADKSKVLSGYTAVTSDSDGEAVAGTMPNLTANTSIQYTTTNQTKVVVGDATFMGTNSDGTDRICVRYNAENGYITPNTLFGRPSTDFGTATAAQVLSGCTFTSTAGLKASGTMVYRGTYATTTSMGQGDNYFALNCIPEGCYAAEGNSWAPEVRISKDTLRNYLGVNAAIIRSGNSIAGVSGTLSVTSAISFSAAATSYNTIRISWTNPSKGPWQGVFIQISTSGYPGTGGGSRAYTGTGTNGSAASGSNYCDITGLTPGTTYYFTCTSYCDALGWGNSYNVMATTPTMSLKAILNSVGDTDPRNYYTNKYHYTTLTLNESTLSATYSSYGTQDSSIVPDSNTIAILLITLNENGGKTILSLCQHWVGKTLVTANSSSSVTRTITGVTLYRNTLNKYQYLQIKVSSSLNQTAYTKIIFPS